MIHITTLMQNTTAKIRELEKRIEGLEANTEQAVAVGIEIAKGQFKAKAKMHEWELRFGSEASQLACEFSKKSETENFTFKSVEDLLEKTEQYIIENVSESPYHGITRPFVFKKDEE